MDTEIKHEQIIAQPTGEKLARLEDIWKTVQVECNQMNENFQSLTPIRDQSEGVEILPGVIAYVLGGPPPKFMGIAMCPHCCRRAAMFARDLANALDDLTQAAEACK